MIDITKVKIGDRVHYQPEHLKKLGEWENGIVKEIPAHTNEGVRVVYNCGGEWEDYQEYTSAMTSIADLFYGWKN